MRFDAFLNGFSSGPNGEVQLKRVLSISFYSNSRKIGRMMREIVEIEGRLQICNRLILISGRTKRPPVVAGSELMFNDSTL